MANASLLPSLEILPHSFVLFCADCLVVIIQIGVTAIIWGYDFAFLPCEDVKKQISFLSSLFTGVVTYVFNPRILETGTGGFL